MRRLTFFILGWKRHGGRFLAGMLKAAENATLPEKP